MREGEGQPTLLNKQNEPSAPSYSELNFNLEPFVQPGLLQIQNKTNKRKKITIIVCSVIICIFCIATVLGILANMGILSARRNNPQSNVCVWNAINESYLNGLYLPTGKTSQSNHPIYSLQIDSSCNTANTMYLFNSIDQIWSISSLEDNTSSIQYIKAICASNVAHTLDECVSLWQMPPGSPQKDVTVSTASKCPETKCTELIMSYDVFLPNEPCVGTFQKDKQLPNLYQKGNSNIYLYFNPSLFRWICGDINMIKQQCIELNKLLGYDIIQSWYNINSFTNGDKTMIQWSNAYNATLSCVSPNTHKPTRSPSMYPTLNPSSSPTTVSKPPTNTPTMSPTNAPTNSPTAEDEGCFASDSYVLTYPNYERKQFNDLQVYDKVLSYDEITNEFIWEEILIKLHFDENEYLNDVLMAMIEFTLLNNQTLTISNNHLLHVINDEKITLKRADEVRIGDVLKVFDTLNAKGVYSEVIWIKENILKNPRGLITYNGNLVVNGVCVSCWTETFWGEHKYFGQLLRFIIRYFHPYVIWRYPFFIISKLWNEYVSLDFKANVHQFSFSGNEHKYVINNHCKSDWFSFLY
eukprot:335627_1